MKQIFYPDEVERLVGELSVKKLTKSNSINEIMKRDNNQNECPYCKSKAFIKNGHTKSKRQKYRCKNCDKNFSDTNNTIYSYTKLSYDQLDKYHECMMNGFSLRKSAEISAISLPTSYHWRHKIMSTLQFFRSETMLRDQIEADEMYETINLKGTKPKNMPRKSKKRKTSLGQRGLSNEQICIITAIDESDNICMKISGQGNCGTFEIESSLGNKVIEYSKLITDSKSSYRDFAKSHNLDLIQIPSGKHNNGAYNLAEVNALHSNYRRWSRKFLGVSCKHLQSYIDWFRYEKIMKYCFSFKEIKNRFISFTFTTRRKLLINDIPRKAFPVNIYLDFVNPTSTFVKHSQEF